MFPGSFFFLQGAEGPECFVMDFSDVVEARFNRGFCGNAVATTRCFCGHLVVKCVVNAVRRRPFFPESEVRHAFLIYF